MAEYNGLYVDRLIESLGRFNRKERFILLNEVCGGSTFRIDSCFARRLEDSLKLRANAIPCSAFVAMDYHLDWIQIALHLNEDRTETNCHPRDPRSGKPSVEDVDILIAFPHSGTMHLILVEAKADTGWSWKQLRSKGDRIRGIFGESGTRFGMVVPRLVLMSPKDPRSRLANKINEWPEWMHPQWLSLPLSGDLQKATRCDEAGYDAEDGRFLRLSGWNGERWVWRLRS